MSGYAQTIKVKDGDKDKNIKMLPFCIDDDKLLGKSKDTWTKIEELKNIELNSLSVYNNRYIQTKIRAYGNKVYTNFCGLNVAEDDIECESFTVISVDSLLIYESKYYRQVYFDNCAYKISNK